MKFTNMTREITVGVSYRSYVSGNIYIFDVIEYTNGYVRGIGTKIEENGTISTGQTICNIESSVLSKCDMPSWSISSPNYEIF